MAIVLDISFCSASYVRLEPFTEEDRNRIDDGIQAKDAKGTEVLGLIVEKIKKLDDILEKKNYWHYTKRSLFSFEPLISSQRHYRLSKAQIWQILNRIRGHAAGP